MEDMSVKEPQVLVDQNDFGLLVAKFVKDCLRHPCEETWTNSNIRKWWPLIEGYYHRDIICAIEMALRFDQDAELYRRPLANRQMWINLMQDLRDPRSSFTIDYECGKCKSDNIKLWRGIHGSSDIDGNDLLCAACLVPGEKINNKGKYLNPEYGMTDQIRGWLPAVPVDDTFWGYGSVPSQDLEWWINLPTYRGAK